MVLSKAKFAGFCGYSSRQVSKWIDEGLPVQVAGRKGVALEIDTAQAIRWLLGKRGDGGGGRQTELAQERKRLVAAQADNAEFEREVKRGNYLRTDEVEAIVCEGAAVFTGQKRSADIGVGAPTFGGAAVHGFRATMGLLWEGLFHSLAHQTSWACCL
ncbi:MAG: hypothetical protein WBN43_21440 [Thiogranum sp.]